MSRFPARLVIVVALVGPLLVACAGVRSQAPPTLTPQETRGRRLFEVACMPCHSTLPDTVIVGPSLAGIADRAAEQVDGLDARAYITQSILDPRAYTVEGFPANLMPDSLAESLAPEDIDALVAYLLSLRQ